MRQTIHLLLLGLLSCLLIGCETTQQTTLIRDVVTPTGDLEARYINGVKIDPDSIAAPAAEYAAMPIGGNPYLNWMSLPHFWTPSPEQEKAAAAKYASELAAWESYRMRLDTDNDGTPDLDIPMGGPPPRPQDIRTGSDRAVTWVPSVIMGIITVNGQNKSHDLSSQSLQSGTDTLDAVNAGSTATLNGFNAFPVP